jgi:UDP-sugar transporter A1/2/3
MVSISKKSSNFSMNTSSNSFRLMLLALMVLQNSSVVLIGRYTRDSKTAEELYVVNHLILVCEAMKFFFACILEYQVTNGQLMKSIKENIIDVPLDALKIIIPSLLYLLQNTLLYVALSNLSAPLFQVTYQSKLLTTAIVSVIMLQRRYSLKQWICLGALGAGVAVVVIGATSKVEDIDAAAAAATEDKPSQSLVTGLVAVTIACFSSALAGVYFEKVLKKPTVVEGSTKAKAPVSLWMRNIQMAFFSVCIACINHFGHYGINEVDAAKVFCHGFTSWVWVVALLQAGGGLLVAAVIKYADNVLKGLATGVSVVSSTAFSMLLFGTPLTKEFMMGSVIILSSVYFFSNDIPSVTKTKVDTPAKEEQKPLADNKV